MVLEKGILFDVLGSKSRQKGFISLVGGLWTSLVFSLEPSWSAWSACAIVESQRSPQADAGSGVVAWGHDNPPYHEVMREKSLGSAVVTK